MTNDTIGTSAPRGPGTQASGDTSAVEAKLDLLLARLDAIEARLEAQDTGLSAELAQPVRLAMAGMTDEMVVSLVQRVVRLAEVILDPGMMALLERFKDPDVTATLERVTDPQVLEAIRGLTGALTLVQSAMTDEMVEGLVKKVSVLGEVVLDPFVLDAIQVLARALKAGQAQYPDVKVPPVGGVFAALRSANDADTRRVFAFALAVAKNLGEEFR
jgi:uncharacterized protein YjgD (DUF1641 family)